MLHQAHFAQDSKPNKCENIMDFKIGWIHEHDLGNKRIRVLNASHTYIRGQFPFIFYN